MLACCKSFLSIKSSTKEKYVLLRTGSSTPPYFVPFMMLNILYTSSFKWTCAFMPLWSDLIPFNIWSRMPTFASIFDNPSQDPVVKSFSWVNKDHENILTMQLNLFLKVIEADNHINYATNWLEAIQTLRVDAFNQFLVDAIENSFNIRCINIIFSNIFYTHVFIYEGERRGFTICINIYCKTLYIYIYIYSKTNYIYVYIYKVKLATLVEVDLNDPFSTATTQKCRKECYSFPWIAPLYAWSVL